MQDFGYFFGGTSYMLDDKTQRSISGVKYLLNVCECSFRFISLSFS